MIDYKNSVVIIGGIGVGKSLVARKLSNLTDMPLVSADRFMYLPKTEQINKMLSCQNLPERTKQGLINCKEIRTKFPNVKNLYDFGYQEDIANQLRTNYGEAFCHYYKKQFYQLLLKNICEEINGAVILELSGDMPISLDEEYAMFKQEALAIYPSYFKKHFTHEEEIGFEKTQEIISRFSTVINLELPYNFSKHGSKANTPVNKVFLATNQYDLLSTKNIDTTGLFDYCQVNIDRLNSICSQICASTNKYAVCTKEKRN